VDISSPYIKDKIKTFCEYLNKINLHCTEEEVEKAFKIYHVHYADMFDVTYS
jgi:hypothetical protein